MNESIAQNSDELENIFTSAFLQYEEQNVIELLDSIFDKNSAEMIETCLNIAKSAAEKCKVKTKFNNTLKHYKKDFAIQKRLEMCTGKITIKNIPKDYTELFNNYKCGNYIVDDTGVYKVIETKEQPLDTDYHEAIAVIPAPDEALKGKILDCVQTGYTLNDKVIRHAKVVVGE